LGGARDGVSEVVLRHEIYENVVRPLEDQLAIHETSYRNMESLRSFEAPENVSSGIQLIKEAFEKFGREQGVGSKIEELGEVMEELQLDYNEYSFMASEISPRAKFHPYTFDLLRHIDSQVNSSR
jgi:hypothetical protein